MTKKKANGHIFVIIAYKESAYLEKCIKSVVAQKDYADAIIFTTTPNDHISNLAEKYKLNVFTGKHTTIGGDFDLAIEAGRKNCECKLVTIAHQDDIYDDSYSCAVQNAFKESK
ncbi:MAG: glycosyltransferase, partial [Candidatus Sacchiramonaceae bacterium]|nr:glycosyltransferase [Candidatus Saccharimonadaceae bacterium]